METPFEIHLDDSATDPFHDLFVSPAPVARSTSAALKSLCESVLSDMKLEPSSTASIQITEPRLHFRSNQYFPGFLTILFERVSKFQLNQFILAFEHKIIAKRLEACVLSCVFHSKDHFLQFKWLPVFKPKNDRLLSPQSGPPLASGKHRLADTPDQPTKRRKTAIGQDILEMKLPDAESAVCESLLTQVAEALSLEVELRRPDHNRVLLCVPLPRLCDLSHFVELQQSVVEIVNRETQSYLNPALSELCVEWELLPVSSK